jgi:DNA (cytosine-5)-methyltransferase 1
MVTPTVISTFAGCGGSSLGYHLAGYKELLAVEWDNNAVETFKLNFPDVPVFHGDIAELSSQKCMEIAKIKSTELDVFDGSPPCQGFSTAGKRKISDPRNSLFKEYARLLQDLQPKVFVMENVTGMIKGPMKQVFLEIIKTLRGCGYRVKAEVMNAMYYDVPQSRERVIFIGVRNDLGIEPSHPKPQSRPKGFESFDDGNRLTGIDLERWKIIPQGGNYLDLPKKLINGKAKFSNFHRKLKVNCPSFTIQKEPHFSSGSFYHWDTPRHISEIELKRIGSFPDNYRFVGNYNAIHNRIGNSVPPNLMKAIALHIREKILTVEKVG